MIEFSFIYPNAVEGCRSFSFLPCIMYDEDGIEHRRTLEFMLFFWGVSISYYYQ